MKSQMALLLGPQHNIVRKQWVSVTEIERFWLGYRFLRWTFPLDDSLFLHSAFCGNFFLLDMYRQPDRRHFGRGGNSMFLLGRHENVIANAHLPQADFTAKINRRRTTKEYRPFTVVMLTPVGRWIVVQNNAFDADMARLQNRLVTRTNILKQIRGHTLGCGDFTFPFQLRPLFVFAAFADMPRMPLARKFFIGAAATATPAVMSRLFSLFLGHVNLIISQNAGKIKPTFFDIHHGSPA